MATGNGIAVVFLDVVPALARLYEAAQVAEQRELAALFGVRQAAISDARRRNRLPLAWLLELERTKGISPLWVITGEGKKSVSEHSA